MKPRATRKPIGLALALVLVALASAPPVRAADFARVMSWADLLERPRATPDKTVAYGSSRFQVADLWLPKGAGPHPTVVMVHGGCWQSREADRTIMNWAAADLRARGIAVWNIDYRGVDVAGGGYPGTYVDVAAAADALRSVAARYRLDLSRVVAVGHSAGGQLALWLAARPRLPRTSPLRSADPLPISAVVGLGGLGDLERAARAPASGCGTAVAATVGGGHLDETSPPRLAPLGVPQVLINGQKDSIVPPSFAFDYAAKLKARGDSVRVRVVPREGHVELIAPGTAAWRAAREEIARALGRGIQKGGPTLDRPSKLQGMTTRLSASRTGSCGGPSRGRTSCARRRAGRGSETRPA